MREHLAELLFHFHTSVAFAILLFATQEGRHTWVSVITVGGLIVWILLSFSLLVHFNNYLLMAPWSVIAVLGPFLIWAFIASAKDIDFYYAGLLTPVWIAVGLNVLVIHDRKGSHSFRRLELKDRVDLETGNWPTTEPNATSSRSGRLRTQDAQTHRRDI